MGVLQAAGMRGVLRLNKKSTFSGRLLISARPDVGGDGGSNGGEPGRIPGVDGQEPEQKEPRV